MRTYYCYECGGPSVMAVRFVASYLGIRPPGSGDENMIDLGICKESFDSISVIMTEDDKIMLKEVHTFCVLDAADYIQEEKVSGEDHELALLIKIALLHDIEGLNSLKPLTVTMIISLIMLSLA